MDETTHKARVQAQFGAAAEAYVTSATHRGGDDLAQLVAWAEGGPDKRALDIATGAGHTALALAPLYAEVVASDLTELMLATAEKFIRSRGVTNVRFERADAEALPFADASFDTVACRIAPHHFAQVDRFVAEVARVLKPGGVFLLEDSVVPEDPPLGEFLNRAEKLRDSTHVRSLTVADWRGRLAAAGLVVEAVDIFRKTHAFATWLDRAKTPAAACDAVIDTFRTASPAARAAFEIVVTPDGTIESYSDDKALLKARKVRE
jgi:SAM-dependent methyltransferase